MTATYFEEIKEELQKGVNEKAHPYQFCTFATIGLETMPRLRTVVLRKVTDDMRLTFFTDRRSKKLIHIKENNKVSMLFYHPEKLLQVKVEGLASIITDEKILNKYWGNVQSNSRKSYTTEEAPGSTISNPDKLEYINTDNHFCLLEIEAFRIEYLKLKRPDHLRIQYFKTDDKWEGEFLVP